MAGELSGEDRKRIREFYVAWKERLLDGDFEGMLELYTDDTMVLPPNHPLLRGKEAVLAFMRSFPPVTRAEFEILEIDGDGEMAYVCGKYSMTLEPEGAPGPVEDEGKFLEIRRKQPDGSWLLTRDIFNSDLPAPGS